LPQIRRLPLQVEDVPAALDLLATADILPQLDGILLVDDSASAIEATEIEGVENQMMRVVAAKPSVQEIIVVLPPYGADLFSRFGKDLRCLRGQTVTTYSVYIYDDGKDFGPSWMNRARWKTPEQRREEEEPKFCAILHEQPILLPDLSHLEHLDWHFVAQEALAAAASRGDEKGFTELLDQLVMKGGSKLRKGEYAEMDWVQEALT